MLLIWSQNASRRQPRIPPVTTSAGLCTPKYRRLNMTQNDQVANTVNNTTATIGSGNSQNETWSKPNVEGEQDYQLGWL